MRKTIKVEKLMNEIRNNVDSSTKCINRGNNELACNYARVAYYLFRTACYMLIDVTDDFSLAYDELATLSGFNEIFKIKILADYINGL